MFISLALVKDGLTNKAIGERLHLSPNTVKEQVGVWASRAGAESRAQLAAWAKRQGF